MKPEENTQEILDKAIEVVTSDEDNNITVDKEELTVPESNNANETKDGQSTEDIVVAKEEPADVSEVNTTDSIPEKTVQDNADQEKPAQDFKVITKEPAKVISKKVYALVLVVVMAFSAVTGFVYTNYDKPQPAVMGVVEEKKMSAVTSVVDGDVSYSNDGKNWQELKAEQVLNQGDWVETSTQSRAVLVLDDGSAIRLNENTKIALTSTNPDAVVIANVNGEVYTRVVTNTERSFIVIVGDDEYKALGTAYKTVNTEKIKGVQVYHSSVKNGDVTIEEGKQWLIIDGTDNKLQEIPLETLKNDEFVKWNAEQDKASSEFKDKLGYLGNLDKVTEEPKTAPAPAPGASIKLSGSVSGEKGIQLSWSTANLSGVDGYKIVKSTKNSTPVFGQDGSLYIKGSSTKSYLWGVTDGGKYYIRVCGYIASNGSCNVYSNTITVTAPKVAKATGGEPSGSLELKPLANNKVEWVLNGSAPNGYKLVWNTEGSPVYPGSNANYYSDPSTKYGVITSEPGTYRVRVCMYNNGSCINYSNELTITVETTVKPTSYR
jgi:hypothetical protein